MNTKLNKSTNSKEIWFHFGIIFFLTLFFIFRLHKNPFFGAITALTALLRPYNAPETVFQSTKIYH